jgi:membrane-bound serine protease (ClpP class)
MKGRLIIAIVSTIAEELGFLVLGFWLLPLVHVQIHWLVVLLFMAVWLLWSIFTYRKGTRALLHKPVPGMAGMVGSTGIVIRPLQPDGLVKIKGELWHCRTESGNITSGVTVRVIKQDGLNLVVRPEPDASGK